MLYSFGSFQVDDDRRTLTRDGEPVPLPERHVDILLRLIVRAGQIVSKDDLIEAAWKDVAVTDNSLEQAISSLRRTLGVPVSGGQYIETLARRGYRLNVPVASAARRHSDEALDEMLAPYRAFIEGRAALETLDREEVVRACSVFEETTRTVPDDPSAHVGLANALALLFESAQSAGQRDEVMLVRAAHHASEACRLDPSSSEAWAVLGLVCHQARDSERAVAALRRAVAIDPDNWRHHLRLSYASWGEERLRGARRVLSLLPGFPFAHWLAATVHVARQALPTAERELAAGSAGQDRQREGAPFQVVGLHLLLGLVRLAGGDLPSAQQAFEREISSEPRAHIYARATQANAWCAVGATRLFSSRQDLALAAFDRALDTVKGHPAATAARAAVTGTSTALEHRLREMREQEQTVEAALAEAVYETLTGHVDRAARLVFEALERAPSGSAAWNLPVDPLLRVGANPAAWERVLTLLRSRTA